ncbi:hypothetical protein HIM_00040 [Hirsutella minnesotensis 3608]|nr:hypothetical protein HIM_00040 [Hirsutella minnesotensis 3608]
MDVDAKTDGETDYNKWSKTGLIQRLRELEAELKSRPAATAKAVETKDAAPVVLAAASQETAKPATPKGKRKIDPSRYSTRFIALKLAYLGKNYGGFEFSASGKQPSIEEELWNALTKSCLIFPDDERVMQWECCEYSKCGRTDRGVSAFGQVIGIRVRSNRPLPKKRAKREEADQEAAAPLERPEEPDEGPEEGKPFDDVKDEICYPKLLNRILPSDIRILAWCPSPPADFSARFSCRERQYRYFFTQPAFSPDPFHVQPRAGRSASGATVKTGWLDIDAMRDAAKRFEGEHDFRNFCKVDGAKQITNFMRVVFESDIVEVQDVHSALPYLQDPTFAAATSASGACPKVYYFHVRGSAFLWHQIRHMVAVLFLVGQGLESPSVVTELLDASKNPCKPSYGMADEVPLVLWDCVFPNLEDAQTTESRTRYEDTLEWIYVGEEHAPNKFGHFGLMDGMWEVWRQRKMDELLAHQLLHQISQQGSTRAVREREGGQSTGRTSGSARTYEGGNTGRLAGKYVCVLDKPRLQSPEEQNERYAKRKGYASSEDMRIQKGMGRGKDDAEADE